MSYGSEFLSLSSQKKTELIVRPLEMQLKLLGYNQNQFRDRTDIRFVIEMMERGFISGCSVSKRARKGNTGKSTRRTIDVVDGNINRRKKMELSATSLEILNLNQNSAIWL